MIFTTVISSFVQLSLALVIPVAWWAVTTRRRVEFATWIGLVVPEWKAARQRLVLALMVWAAVAVLSVALLSSAAGGTASSRFAGSGIYGAIAVLFYAFIQTGLSRVPWKEAERKVRIQSWKHCAGRGLRSCTCGSAFLSVHPASTYWRGSADCGQWLDYGLGERRGGRRFHSSQLDDAFPCQPPRWLGSGVWVSCLRDNSANIAELFRGRLGTVKPR